MNDTNWLATTRAKGSRRMANEWTFLRCQSWELDATSADDTYDYIFRFFGILRDQSPAGLSPTSDFSSIDD